MYTLSSSMLPSSFAHQNHLPYYAEAKDALRVGEPAHRALNALAQQPALAATFATYTDARNKGGMAATMQAAILSSDFAREYPIHLHHFVSIGMSHAYYAVRKYYLPFFVPKRTATPPLSWEGVRSGIMSWSQGYEMVRLTEAGKDGGHFTLRGETFYFNAEGQIDKDRDLWVYPVRGL